MHKTSKILPEEKKVCIQMRANFTIYNFDTGNFFSKTDNFGVMERLAFSNMATGSHYIEIRKSL